MCSWRHCSMSPCYIVTVCLQRLLEVIVSVCLSVCLSVSFPGIHLITPGLLQLNIIRHHWQLVWALTSRSKCYRTSYHWRAAYGPHHSDPTAFSLAPGLRTSHLQARLVGFQGVAWSVAAVSRGWLSAASRYRAPSTPIGWRCDLFCPADSLVSQRSLFRCGWTENMEQFAYQIATTTPQPWTI